MDKYYQRIKSNLNLTRIKEIARQIFQFEYPFCYRGFAGSAQLCFKELQRSGADRAELITLPADGKTAYFDFIMPEAWDVEEASLDIIEPAGLPHKRILDLKESSFCVANRCAATPAEGITAELISWEEAQKKEDLAGKIVFTLDIYPGEVRDDVVAKNGLGIISSFSEGRADLPDGIFWANGWKGGPGWYHTAPDKKIICFNISPRRGKELSRLLEKHQKVKVLAKVKSRTYDGSIYSVTGLIPGSSRKEILLMAHLYEPHLDDNAIGAAALIEICRIIKAAVEAGDLPPLKRSIRFLMSQERYGFAQFFSDRKQANRVMTAINVDAVASGPAKTKEPIRIRYSPMSQPFFGDFLLERLVSEYLPEKYPRQLEKGNFSDDTWPADRTIGVPTNWLWTPPAGYHHNSLNAGALDWNLVREMVAIIATYVYCLSSDESGISRRIGEIALETAQTKSLEFYRMISAGLLEEPGINKKETKERSVFFNGYLDKSLETLQTIGVSASKIKHIREQVKKVSWTEQKKLCRKVCENEDVTKGVSRLDKKAANMVVKRITRGIPFSLDKVPAEERRKLPNEILEPIINWLDGERDLAEAFRFFEYEHERRPGDPEKEALINTLIFLEKYGYFKICPKTVLTKSEIKKDLKALGIRAGDRVAFHSSLSGIGHVKGGPAAVCRALMELITGKGTILMPSFNHGQVFAEGARGYFSPVETPTSNGTVPEYFRRLPGVFRSLDPTHPFLAWGRAAQKYIWNHHRLITMGEGSPLHLLEKAGGKVILIDAPLSNTFHHVVEMTDNVPCLGKRTEEYPVKLPNGVMVRCRTWGWRNGDCPISDSAQYLRLMKKSGLLKEGRIGNAQVLVFRMSDCRKVLEELLAGRVKGFGGCRVCRIRPRVNKWTVASDWDEEAKRVRLDTTAFTGDYPE